MDLSCTFGRGDLKCKRFYDGKKNFICLEDKLFHKDLFSNMKSHL